MSNDLFEAFQYLNEGLQFKTLNTLTTLNPSLEEGSIKQVTNVGLHLSQKVSSCNPPTRKVLHIFTVTELI